MVILLGGLVLAAILIGTFYAGLVVGAIAQARRGLRELGFTKESAKLYHRAAKILNRLVNVTELDGDFAADILSEETKKIINGWVADYRKEIEKV